MTRTRYWLTPVQLVEDRVVLKGERLSLEPEAAAADFLKQMRQAHPRLLVSFKASLLLSEEAEEACGVDELPFALGSKESIVFGPRALELSHCAQAYLDRLPSAMEFTQWLSQWEAESPGLIGADTLPAQWIRAMKEWLQQGYGVTLLREDE